MKNGASHHDESAAHNMMPPFSSLTIAIPELKASEYHAVSPKGGRMKLRSGKTSSNASPTFDLDFLVRNAVRLRKCKSLLTEMMSSMIVVLLTGTLQMSSAISDSRLCR